MSFDRLLDLLLEFLGFFRFCVVVDDYEQAVVLRFGRYHRTLEPGFHWLWPFYVERPLTMTVVTNTSNLGAQSLTTVDSVQCVVAAIVTWRVKDVRKLLLEVEGQTEALHDTAYGVIASYVLAHSWADVASPAFGEAVTAEVRRKSWRYGIEVMQVQFSDVSRTRSLRVWTGQ